MNTTQNKKVYLTIDDGLSNDARPKLDLLLAKGIPAILFCRGDLLQRSPDIAIYAIQKGFVIGNHSYSHPSFSHIDLNIARQEITRSEHLIDNVYKRAHAKRPAKIFRFPYGDNGGANKPKIQKILSDQGYQQPRFLNIRYAAFLERSGDKDTHWTVDLEEYRLDTQAVGMKLRAFDPHNTASPLDRNSSEILLLHDHERTTKEFLRIIEQLSRMDLDFQLPAFS
jgi:peptidoglycan-N-acetylglucosamine deacetylase